MSHAKQENLLFTAIIMTLFMSWAPIQSTSAQPAENPSRTRRSQLGHRPADSAYNWRRGLWVRMSDSERDQVYDFIETNFPRMFLELERLRSRNPKRFDHRMNRVVVDMQQLMEMVELHPQRGALAIQERKLDLNLRFSVAKYRRSHSEKEKRRLESTMKDLIGQVFDIQSQRQELEVKELETRLVELRRRIQRRQAHRKDFIQRHLRKLRNGPDGPDGPGGPGELSSPPKPARPGRLGRPGERPDRDWLSEPGHP